MFIFSKVKYYGYRFETERLLLRGWKDTDLQDLHEIMSNEKVAVLAGFQVKRDLAQTNKILQVFQEEPENALWAIEWKEDGKVIGWIELHDA